MNTRFTTFVQRLNEALAQEIVTAVEFGSRNGEQHPELSDIDLLVLSKDRNSISHIISTVRSIEKETLNTTHSHLIDEVERNLFGSRDFTGVHLIVFSQNELDEQFNPKSIRLKLLSGLLLSKTIFLYHLKHGSRVLIGKNILKDIPLSKPTTSDRIKLFIPLYLLMVLMPLLASNNRQFRIWCFKIVKYLGDSLETYARMVYANDTLTVEDLSVNTTMIEQARKFRYNPFKYPGSSLGLYCKTWLCLLKATPFLWQGVKLLHREKEGIKTTSVSYEYSTDNSG